MLPLHYTLAEVRDAICSPGGSRPYIRLFEDWNNLFVENQRLQKELDSLRQPANDSDSKAD